LEVTSKSNTPSIKGLSGGIVQMPGAMHDRDGSLQRMHSFVTTSYGEVIENSTCKVMVSTLLWQATALFFLL
jgi:hypothetical protein